MQYIIYQSPVRNNVTVYILRHVLDKINEEKFVLKSRFLF
jgi:hypothetical protein